MIRNDVLALALAGFVGFEFGAMAMLCFVQGLDLDAAYAAIAKLSGLAKRVEQLEANDRCRATAVTSLVRSDLALRADAANVAALNNWTVRTP